MASNSSAIQFPMMAMAESRVRFYFARLDTEKLGITFYACFDGKNRIKETASLGTRSLSSYGETIRGGKKKTAVLLFQIPKDQADKISGETLYAEIKDTIYSLKYK